MIRDFSVIKCPICAVPWSEHGSVSPDCAGQQKEEPADPSVLAAIRANKDIETRNKKFPKVSLNSQQAQSVDSKNIACWEFIIKKFSDKHKNEEYCEHLIEIFRERNEICIKKYGIPVMINNGRNSLIDAFQEFLDAYVYLQQAILEEKWDVLRLRVIESSFSNVEISIIQIYHLVKGQLS